jgi:hypothetical protein
MAKSRYSAEEAAMIITSSDIESNDSEFEDANIALADNNLITSSRSQSNSEDEEDVNIDALVQNDEKRPITLENADNDLRSGRLSRNG